MRDTLETHIEPTVPSSYSERMEAFPDVNEDLKKYGDEERQKVAAQYFAKYFAMMKAMSMGRASHTRVNSWGNREPHRTDGSPMTKPSRGSRSAASHKQAKAARLARVKSR